jgi:hypothetical protein
MLFTPACLHCFRRCFRCFRCFRSFSLTPSDSFPPAVDAPPDSRLAASRCQPLTRSTTDSATVTVADLAGAQALELEHAKALADLQTVSEFVLGRSGRRLRAD